ncbi:hypothetical protein BLNAU_13908 [Blattamonas nauphoetae]|uniref:Uncharacterized protein n=1 Tax=Blattamonas nauphoetae TaxID=2049346 RepID=A0ABQ9XIA3_9EUKA|nr:hypothetical protein BLNAU_13908 [Blattamonas nauphoetae]
MNENPTSLLDDESILGSPSSEETTDGSSLIDETESEEESEESDAHARIHLRVPIHADPLINLESIHPITFADYQIPKHQAVLPVCFYRLFDIYFLYMFVYSAQDDPDETLEDFIDDAEQQPIILMILRTISPILNLSRDILITYVVFISLSQRQLSSNNLTDSITSEHDKATEMHQVTKRSGLKRKGSNSSGGRREADFESRKREEQNSDALETFDSSVSTSFALESFTSPQSPANLPSVPHNQSSSVGSNVMPVGVIPPQPTKPKPGVRIKHPNILPTIPASTFMLPAHAVPSTAPPWNQQSAISPQPQRQPVQPDSYSTRQKDQTVQFSVRQDPNLPRSSPTSPKPLTSHLNQVSEPPQTSHHSTGSVLFTSQAPIFPSSEQDLNETT